jgi:acetyltransferase
VTKARMSIGSGDECIRFRGRTVRLRELQANDRSRIETLLGQVAATDIQMRFFSALRRVPAELLDQLMRVDPTQRVTVAAVLESDGGTDDAQILGVARAHRTVGDTAEVALLVRSDLKGQGLGTILLGRLIVRCREWGILHLVADVMRSNSRMLRLAETYCFRRELVQDDICRIALDLSA